MTRPYLAVGAGRGRGRRHAREPARQRRADRAPVAQATTSPPSDVRGLPGRPEVLDGGARPRPGDRAHGPPPPRPPPRHRRSARSGSGWPGRLQRHPLPQGLHAARRRRQHRGLGRQRHRLPGRRLPQQIPASTEITDAQVATWSTSSTPTCSRRRPPRSARRRTATAPTPCSARSNGNGGVYTGAGDKTVTLVDNVRDDNFYDFPAAPTYIAGFFFSQFNELIDRNVMTIDAYDWLHRTGAEPAGRADGRPVHQPPGPAAPVRGRVRARVAAPAALLHRPVRDDLDQRGPVRLRPDPDRLRRRARRRSTSGRRQPHLLLPGLRHRADTVQPQPARLRWPGELAEHLG